MRKYRINIKTLDGKYLVFNVSSYDILNNCLIEFFDEKTDQYKCFPVANCEITYSRIGEIDE